MPKIKSFEEACKALNISQSLPDVSALPAEHQQAIMAHYKLVIIAQALNEGWIPNWNDTTQPKYTPRFEVKASSKKTGGSELVYVSYYGWYTNSHVGSRLCFKDRYTAKYAATTFKKIYEEYFLIK